MSRCLPFARFNFKDVVLITFCMLFTAIIYYRDFAVVDFNKLYLVAATFAVASIMDYKRIIYLLCFLFPLSCGIPGNFIYPLLVCLLFIKDQKKSINKLLFFIVILLLELSHYGFYAFDTRISEFIGYASFIFMLSYIIADNNRDVDNGRCLTYFCLGSAILLLGITINNTLMINQLDPINGIVRLGDNRDLGGFEEDRMMLLTNANTIGYYSIAAISCLLVLQYFGKINSILFLLLFAIAFYGGILSVSRTWAILMVFAMVVYMTFLKHDKIKGILLMVALCIGVVIFLSNNELVLEYFTTRFTEDSNDIATAGGRTTVFQKYSDYLADNPLSLLFGTGAVYYREATGVGLSTHNAIQQILVSYGLLGLIIFVIALLKNVRRYFNRNNVMTILPLCMTLLFVQTIQFLNPYFLMCPIIVAFYALKMGKYEDKIC